MNDLIDELKALGCPQKAQHLQRFFKTGAGQYGEGDIFWGITVPEMRKVARKYKDVDSSSLEKLLAHKVHEVRLCALLVMVAKAKAEPQPIFKLYLSQTKYVNNWDLVDLSAPTIVGAFLIDKDCAILYELANSKCLWDRRIAMVSTYAFIKQGQSEHTLELSRILMNDSEDLIHKAAGWMLREVGKRCSREILEQFLEEYAATMPRTMLRYSIEHFAPEKRAYFLGKK